MAPGMAVMITEETKLIWSVKSVLSLSLERLHVCPKGRQRGKPEILTLHCKNTGVFFFMTTLVLKVVH